MQTKYSLARRYQDNFEQFATDHSSLSNFFSKTLQIPNCTWEVIVEDIRKFKEIKSTDFDRIRKLYKCLEDMDLIAISAGELK